MELNKVVQGCVLCFNAFLLGLGSAARGHSFIRLIYSHGLSERFWRLNPSLSQ